MNNACPGCGVELKWKYTGALTKCPVCGVRVVYNLHDSEGKPWYRDIIIFLAMLCAAVITIYSTGNPLILISVLSVIGSLGAIYFHRRSANSTPSNWPRWRIEK